MQQKGKIQEKQIIAQRFKSILLKTSLFFSYGAKNQSSTAFLISVGDILAATKSHRNYGYFPLQPVHILISFSNLIIIVFLIFIKREYFT